MFSGKKNTVGCITQGVGMQYSVHIVYSLQIQCMGKGLHQWKCFKALVFVIRKILWEIREV